MDPTGNVDWVKLVSQLGFPIFTCIWFMWRDYKFLSTLQEELEKLNTLLEAALKIK
jgi:hypothetical protein